MFWQRLAASAHQRRRGDLDVAGERITGPLRRHFFASYALASCDGFVGYAKICRKPPEDIWGCEAILKVGVDVQPSPEEAMRLAELRAQGWLDFLIAGSDRAAPNRS